MTDSPAETVDELFSLTYEELRRLAAVVKRRDPEASVSPTTLVHEAWVKLRAHPSAADTSPLHFKRIAARAMRQVLVEAARRRKARKRGGGAVRVTLSEAISNEDRQVEELLVLDRALDDLERLSPRQAELVQARFFGGLEVRETAEVLGVSESTVSREWRAARAWLVRRLGQDG